MERSGAGRLEFPEATTLRSANFAATKTTGHERRILPGKRLGTIDFDVSFSRLSDLQVEDPREEIRELN